MYVYPVGREHLQIENRSILISSTECAECTIHHFQILKYAWKYKSLRATYSMFKYSPEKPTKHGPIYCK